MRASLERRLADLAERRRALREELAVVDEQLTALGEAADDARLRALVSETPQSGADHREASRSAEAMARHRAVLAADVARLDQQEDALLDQLSAR